MKIVADKTSDEVLGIHMIGSRSTELVAEATLALEGLRAMRYADLRGGEDDRLTCAGTTDAFVRGFDRETAV